MTFNTIIFCASALFIQSIAGHYCPVSVPVSICGCGSVSNDGGAFTVQSAGPIAPSGVATATDLSLAAELALSGAVPLLSVVEFGGQLPVSGAGAVAYGSGDSSVAITQVLGAAAAYGLNSLGRGCRCGCRF